MDGETPDVLDEVGDAGSRDLLFLGLGAHCCSTQAIADEAVANSCGIVLPRAEVRQQRLPGKQGAHDRRYVCPTIPSTLIPLPPRSKAHCYSVPSLTPSAAFLTQKCQLPTRTIKFEIWDTAGQERFASLAPMYYRNAQSALVVYDITKSTSLIKAKHWVAELQRQASPGIVIALVGNKLDLANPSSSEPSPAAVDEEGAERDEDAGEDNEDARKVSTKEARDYAEDEGLLFFETSAKEGTGVQEVFTAIANAIPETQLKGARGAGGQQAQGQREESRVNLNQASGGQKGDGCAC